MIWEIGQLQALLSAVKTVLLRACVELADWEGPKHFADSGYLIASLMLQLA